VQFFNAKPSRLLRERRVDYNNTRKVEPAQRHENEKKKQHAVSLKIEMCIIELVQVLLPCFGVYFTVQVRIHANRSACRCVLNILSPPVAEKRRSAARTHYSLVPLLEQTIASALRNIS
jgi:hypothetical protein